MIILKNKMIILFSILESFFQVYGYILTKGKSITNFNFYNLLSTIFLFIVFVILNNLFYKFLSIKLDNNINYNFSKKKFLLTWLIIFLLWVPILLAFYPSIWSYDAYRQIPHINNTSVLTFQPIFHTLFIEAFLFVGKYISGFELGLLLLSIAQMLILSCIFAYCIEKMKTITKDKKVGRIISILMIIYFGLIPFNSVLSISVTKDNLFSGFLLLLIIVSNDIINYEEVTNGKKILFVISSILLIIIKNNALNIYLIFLLVSMFLLKKKKLMFKLCTISIFIYYVVYIAVVVILVPEKNYKMEKYNVQSQNLIYIVLKHPELDVQEDEKLFDFVPRSCFSKDISLNYNVHNSDNAKETLVYCFNNDFDDINLIKVWGKYLIKYPLDYFDSWSNVTIGSWYLLDKSHAEIYSYDHLKGYLATGFKDTYGLESINHESKIPWLKKIIEALFKERLIYKKYNIFRFVFQPASYILTFLFLTIFSLKKKNVNNLILLSPLFAVFISVLIGPCILIRYIYPFMVCLPFLIFRTINSNV